MHISKAFKLLAWSKRIFHNLLYAFCHLIDSLYFFSNKKAFYCNFIVFLLYFFLLTFIK